MRVLHSVFQCNKIGANCNYAICIPWSQLAQMRMGKNGKHLNSRQCERNRQRYLGEMVAWLEYFECSDIAAHEPEMAKSRAFIKIYWFRPLIRSQIEHRFADAMLAANRSSECYK